MNTMNFYEYTFIARPDLSIEGVEALASLFSNIIKERNGVVIKQENWGLRNLAYPIKKYKRGYYIMLGLQAGAEAMDEVMRNAHINSNVLKSLRVRVDKIDNTPSPILESEDTDDSKDQNQL